MTDLALKYGLGFPDLYDRDGLVRLDRAFVAHLGGERCGAARPADGGARAIPRRSTARRESDLLVELAPHVEDFLGELFGIAAEIRELQARHRRAGAALFGEAAVRAAPRGQGRQGGRGRGARRRPALARELEALIGGPIRADIAGWERRYAEHVARWLDDEAGTRRGARRRAALRRLGDAVARGAGKAPARRALQGAAPARHAPSRAGRDRRARRRHDAAPARGRLARIATASR